MTRTVGSILLGLCISCLAAGAAAEKPWTLVFNSDRDGVREL